MTIGDLAWPVDGRSLEGLAFSGRRVGERGAGVGDDAATGSRPGPWSNRPEFLVLVPRGSEQRPWGSTQDRGVGSPST